MSSPPESKKICNENTKSGTSLDDAVAAKDTVDSLKLYISNNRSSVSSET